MAGKHRRQADPRTDASMTVDELQQKLADLQDEADNDDYAPKSGTLDDND